MCRAFSPVPTPQIQKNGSVSRKQAYRVNLPRAKRMLFHGESMSIKSVATKSSKSFMAKPGEVESKWYIIDATDLVLGRLASQVATILKGKNKPEYTPNVDCGDHVIIINCDKVKLTGKKLEQKYYRYHTGYIGGLKEVQYKKLMLEKPEFAVYKAVRGMLPKTTLGREMLKKLRVYAGGEHSHQAQQPVALELK
jgi:large subunit ribosomal protein L13